VNCTVTQPERDSCVQQLEQLRATFAGQLSESQNAKLSAADEQIRCRTQKLAEEACKWLGVMRVRAQDCRQLQRFLVDLQRCPEFLPEGQKADLQAIVEQAEQRSLASREQERLAQEGIRKDADTMSYLRGMSKDAPLKNLREALECVVGAQCLSEQARSLRAQKEAELRLAITSLETFVAGIGSRFDAVMTSSDAANLHHEITEKRLFYRETPEAAVVEAALTRCAQAEDFIKALNAVPINKFRTTAEYDACAAELTRVRDCTDGLSLPSRSKLVCAAERKMIAHVKSLEEHACDWLTQMQSRAKNSQDPDRLLSELRAVPEFLPDEKKPQLVSLREQVLRMADQDVCARIRQMFRQIADTQAMSHLRCR